MEKKMAVKKMADIVKNAKDIVSKYYTPIDGFVEDIEEEKHRLRLIDSAETNYTSRLIRPYVFDPVNEDKDGDLEPQHKVISKSEQRIIGALVSAGKKNGIIMFEDVCKEMKVDKNCYEFVDFDPIYYDQIAESFSKEDLCKLADAVHSVYGYIYQPYVALKGIPPYKMWRTPGGYTTVEWCDGTKTTVKAEKEETDTVYSGFCACLAKKYFGSTSNAIAAMNSADNNAKWRYKQKQIEKERIKKRKAEISERKREWREEKIREEMEAIRIRNEAERRLMEAENNGDC